MNQGKIMTIHCATCGAPAQFGRCDTELPLSELWRKYRNRDSAKKASEFRSLTKLC